MHVDFGISRLVLLAEFEEAGTVKAAGIQPASGFAPATVSQRELVQLAQISDCHVAFAL